MVRIFFILWLKKQFFNRQTPGVKTGLKKSPLKNKYDDQKN